MTKELKTYSSIELQEQLYQLMVNVRHNLAGKDPVIYKLIMDNLTKSSKELNTIIITDLTEGMNPDTK